MGSSWQINTVMVNTLLSSNTESQITEIHINFLRSVQAEPRRFETEIPPQSSCCYGDLTM